MGLYGEVLFFVEKGEMRERREREEGMGDGRWEMGDEGKEDGEERREEMEEGEEGVKDER